MKKLLFLLICVISICFTSCNPSDNDEYYTIIHSDNRGKVIKTYRSKYYTLCNGRYSFVPVNTNKEVSIQGGIIIVVKE